MPDIRSKLPKEGTTIFTIMSALATKHEAINLSQGFPDFAGPKKLLSLVYEHMKLGHNQYAPMAGILPLREAISEKMEGLYTTQYHPESEITITAGATQAIYSAITAVVREGDEVIIFEPAYDCYTPAIKLNRGIPVFVRLEAPEYGINWENVRKVVSSKTRMIIINSPHNPTGATLKEADLQELQKITEGSEIIVLSDEVYEHIIFDEQAHHSVALYPGLKERSFVTFSFGKTYHNTGWKMGYCLAPEGLMKEFRKVHQFIVFAVNRPMQHAFADFLQEKDHYLELNAFYQEKRDYFNSLLESSRFKIIPSGGTYFQLAQYDAISDEKDTDFAARITKEFGIASIPVSVFYHQAEDNKMLRFCFAKEKATLIKAAEKLCKI